MVGNRLRIFPCVGDFIATPVQIHVKSKFFCLIANGKIEKSTSQNEEARCATHDFHFMAQGDWRVQS
jgi:hypothetical protein